MHNRVLSFVAALSVALTFAASTRPAFADNGNGRGDNIGWTDGSGVGADASQPVTPVAAGSGGGSGGQSTCTYELLNAQDSAISDDMATSGWGPPRGNSPGSWYRKICTDANGMASGVIVWAPGAAAVDPAALAQQALGYTPMPPPSVGMSPPPGREQLVNLTTFLWIDGSQWHPVSASASAGGVGVVTTATPERAVWAMGNGESVTCDGPGTPYDPSRLDADQPDPCRYTYRHSSAGRANDAFVMTVTVEWHITWVATGAPPGAPTAGDLGVVGRSSSVPVRVAEAEATNTSAR